MKTKTRYCAICRRPITGDENDHAWCWFADEMQVERDP